MGFHETLNIDYIETQYDSWKSDPESVPKEWGIFFSGFEFAGGRGVSPTPATFSSQALLQSRVEALKYRYRDLGHLMAGLDPLSQASEKHPYLSLGAVGLTEEDLSKVFFTRRFSETKQAKLSEIIAILEETYCGSIGVEYMHLQDPEERRWLQERMEPLRNRPNLAKAEKVLILNKLVQAGLFEEFLNRKYVGQTRFSLEGAEALVPMLDFLLKGACQQGASEVILGMSHRGRLNVTANNLYKLYDDIFLEFVNDYDASSIYGAGDAKYHEGYFTEIDFGFEGPLKVFLVNNPSHLESVDPVAEGIAKARQEALEDPDGEKVLPVLIHGDAAFAGQGVVTETLNLSQLEGYGTGGTIHIIVNNQIGYTTLPENARSTRYSSDVAKMLMVPIFHVTGEDPEAAVSVMRLAVDYRRAFGKDVVVDLVCYRRYGHNEGDEPYFTQPKMYEKIRQRDPVFRLYGQKLLKEGAIDRKELAAIDEGITTCLGEAYENAESRKRMVPAVRFFDQWSKYSGTFSHEMPETAVAGEQLVALAEKLNTLPAEMDAHPKIARLLKKRGSSVAVGRGIDWATAEALTFASILQEGTPIRLSGQDSGRGTFSQRHAVLVDRKTGRQHVPLNGLSQEQAPFSVHNSMLSEYAVLGFEYGYSLVSPDHLVLWEAQFGDFANNAQAIIDLYIASGQTKWRKLSGLVLLLPHGSDGLGPEHSSARLERFLQLCAGDNMQVVNLTTPAQYFHCLRRQVKAPWRKPLVVMSPKSMLRHPLAVSHISDFTDGRFQAVIDDQINGHKPRRVLFCSGKLYHSLYTRREKIRAYEVIIIRLEQLYPFPEEALSEVIAKYREADQWCWVQEEHENMGAWTFVRPRIEAILGKRLTYIGRGSSPSPATGFANVYKQEQAALSDRAVGMMPEETKS